MRSYECAVILHPAVTEDGLKASTAKYVDIIAGKRGEITKVETWGKRRLSYEINKQPEGHYYFYRFRGDAALIAELGRHLRIDEQVLRHMIVRDETAVGDEVALAPGTVEATMRAPEPEESRPYHRGDRDDERENRGYRDRGYRDHDRDHREEGRRG